MNRFSSLSQMDMNENSALLNRIHQSIIYFENNPSKDQAQNILKEYIPSIDTKIDFNTANELFSLILTIFIRYPEQPPNFFNEILEKSRLNSNRVVFTSMIFSHLNGFKNQFSFSDYRSFVSDSFQQILNQIKKPENEKFVIFGHEIQHQFKANFIINILLMTKIKEKYFKIFYPLIFSHKENIHKNQLSKFIQKVLKSGFGSLFPCEILNDEYLFSCFNMNSLSLIIPHLSDELFQSILPQIEEIFEEEKKWIRPFSISILDRIVKLNIKFKLIDNLLQSISPLDLNISVWEYLAKFDVILPLQLSSKIKKIPNSVLALKIMPKINEIPSLVLSRGLLKLSDFGSYEKVFNSEEFIVNDVFSTSKFWIHVVSVASKTGEKCSEQLIKKFAEIFINYIDEDNVFKILDEMIFSKDTIVNNGINFISDLMSHLNGGYLTKYYQNIEIIFQKIVDKGTIPLPSIWKIIDINYIINLLETNNTNPILMYAYEFSNKNKNSSFFKKVSISSKLNSQNRILINEFINRNNDFDFLTKTNEEVLSFILSALIYTGSQEKPEIQGLSKENILPFFAISFNYMDKYEGNLSFISPNILNILQAACKYLSRNNSPLLITSINTILYNFEFFCNNKIFSIHAAFLILDILIPLLIRNLYKADKVILLSIIFYLSSQNSLDEEMKSLFIKHGINLFKFIIQKMLIIHNFEKLKSNRLNLEVFELNQIKKIIIENIQNSSSNEITINTIFIIEKFCKKVPKLEFNDLENLNKIFHEKIDEKNWDAVLLIGQFFLNNNLKSNLQKFSNKPIPFRLKEILFDEIKIENDELISVILSDPEPETHYLPFELLFNNLMKDEIISMNYIMILFEKVTHKQTLNLNLFLDLYSDIYNNYDEIVIKTLSYAYVYHSESQSFIRNTETKKLPTPKKDFSLVSNLIEKVEQNSENFQAIFCLYNIASSFPFLFIEHSQNIFNIILPVLDNFPLLLKNKNESENDGNKIKAVLSALLFLYKLLYSIEILNLFIPWILENIIKFSESQILSFTFIIKSLMDTKKVRKVFLSLSLQYNIPKIINKLLHKKVSTEIYQYYQQCLLFILISYYNYFSHISKNKIIYINEIRNIKNAIQNEFNNFSTIFPYNLAPITFSSLFNDNDDQISNFLTYAIESRQFWLTFSKPDSEDSDFESEIDDFILHYTSLYPDESDECDYTSIPNMFFECNIQVIQYLSVRPNWIYQVILNDISFPFLTKHYEILFNCINELNQYDDEIDVLDLDIDIKDYFMQEYCCEDLFKYLIELALNSNDILYDKICSLFIIITEKVITVVPILNIINLYLLNQRNEKEISLNFVIKLVDILFSISNNNEFENNFIEICGKNLIDIVISPEFRNNPNLLLKLSNLLCVIDNELPLNTTHLIGFMLILNQQEIVPQALTLCEKIGIEKINCLIPIIDSFFDREINKECQSFYMIKNYLEKFPFLAKPRKEILIKILNNAIIKYKNSSFEDEIDEEDCQDLICSIFNSLAPERRKDLIITPLDMDEIDFSLSRSTTKAKSTNSSNLNYLENKIPLKIVQTNPPFWDLYQKNIELIDEIIERDQSKLGKMNFLFDYPEMMNFKIRTLYFREKMKQRINQQNELSIIVKRSKVLSNSFKQLKGISTKEWLNKITVSFVGEEGLDAGGLTKEWFYLIVKELFEPERELFQSTENKSYQPVHSDENHLELIKFAGKIIARSLIQGQCVNAHLTRSFIRQILHHKVKLNDLEDFDENIFKSLQMILNDEDNIEELDLNFTIDVEEKGEYKTISLKENGENINVTNENKHEYISLYTNYHLRTSIKDEINAFCEGFESLIQPDEIRFFTASELDLLICGIPEIDVENLRQFTEYAYPYCFDHPVIELFFNVISKWDNDVKAKFLLFLTGSSQVPLNGFKYFRDIGKPITISPGGSKERLCVAHTCFNTLDLPEYENEDEMNDKLILSIQECEFGIA